MPTPVRRIIETAVSRSQLTNLVYPEDIGPHGMLLVFREYVFSETRNQSIPGRPNFSTPTGLRVGNTVMLPLPKNLADTTSVNIQGQQLGIFGEDIARGVSGLNAAGNASEIASAITSALGRSLSGISDTALAGWDYFNTGTLPENFGSQASFLMRRSLDRLPGNIGRAVDAGLGSIVNPKAAIAFDGVTLKQHNFDWDFYPRSENESSTIKDIFNMLKRNSLPSYINVGTRTATGENAVFARGLLKYPSIVDVFLIGVDPSYYIYYKTSMISQIVINFTPQQGHVVMAGGRPGAVNMSLTLLETDIHTSEDYGGSSQFSIDENRQRFDTE